MDLTIRLDYVPWDAESAAEFGHAEPAMILRLMDVARVNGTKYHFFASTRALQAFPAMADLVLNEGHHLDWLCTEPATLDAEFMIAKGLLGVVGVTPEVVGLTFLDETLQLEGVRFAGPGEMKSDRDAIRSGLTFRLWSEQVKSHLRAAKDLKKSQTIVLHPQVIGKFDPQGAVLSDLLKHGLGLGFKIRTLREDVAR
ncbi:MAG: hypothetical protein K8R88_04245 [Armatimonadetes bacterium]|nr:hypothetical protein [Armatimonadota bacterium]